MKFLYKLMIVRHHFSKIILFSLLISFLGCQQKPVFEYSKEFKNDQWNRFDFVEATVDIKNTNEMYDLQLILTSNDKYIYDYIALNISLFFSDETVRSRDIEIRLQDKELNWLGSKENGIVTTPFTYIHGLKFPATGKTKIRIENKMSKILLENVSGLKIILTKSGVK